MKIQILGAGLDVGRSCLLATIASRHILLDCGAHHGFADKRRFPDFSSLPPQILNNIECTLVTHFHFDHAAALPYLTCNHNCKAPIYMTEPTYHLTSLMLHDFLSTSATRQHSCPFNESDVRTMLSRVKIMHVGEPFDVLPSTEPGKDDAVSVTAYPAGHTLGAVMLYVRSAGESLLYSGDYSLRPDRVLPTAALPPGLSPQVFVTEATYCSSVRSPTDDTESDMISAVLNSLSKRGKVLFPISAFGRVHSICASLSRLTSQFPLHEVPMYVVSGTTTKALDIYNRFADDWTIQSCKQGARCVHCQTSASDIGSASSLKTGDETRRNDIRDESKENDKTKSRAKTEDNNNLGKKAMQQSARKETLGSNFCTRGLLDNLRPFNRTHDWHVVDGPGPVIMFATPANLSTGISRQVFQAWCTQANNLIVMPSASFATTVAANAANDISAYSNSPQLRCKIVNSLSACHPDSADILRICRHIDPKSIMFIHGEETKVLAFRERVEKVLGVPCFAPANCETVDVSSRLRSISPSRNMNENDQDREVHSKSVLPLSLLQLAKANGIALPMDNATST